MTTLANVPSLAGKGVNDRVRTARVVMRVFMCGIIQEEIVGEVEELQGAPPVIEWWCRIGRSIRSMTIYATSTKISA
jgi:hypothetical protein